MNCERPQQLERKVKGPEEDLQDMMRANNCGSQPVKATSLAVLYAKLGAGQTLATLRPLQRRNLVFREGVLLVHPHSVVLFDSATRATVASSRVIAPRPHPLFEWLMLAAHMPAGPEWLQRLTADSPRLLSVIPAVLGNGLQQDFGRGDSGPGGCNQAEVAMAITSCGAAFEPLPFGAPPPSILSGAELCLGGSTLLQVEAANDLPLAELLGVSLPASTVMDAAPMVMVKASNITNKRRASFQAPVPRCAIDEAGGAFGAQCARSQPLPVPIPAVAHDATPAQGGGAWGSAFVPLGSRQHHASVAAVQNGGYVCHTNDAVYPAELPATQPLLDPVSKCGGFNALQPPPPRRSLSDLRALFQPPQ